MRVLICDDDPVIRYLLKVVLSKRAGDEVIEVADPDAVFEAADRHRPELIVLDYVMPNRNGADVVEELRTDETLGSIPVVFLNGRSDIAEETRGIRETLSDFTKWTEFAPLGTQTITCLEGYEGTVYLAEDATLNRRVALKVLTGINTCAPALVL